MIKRKAGSQNDFDKSFFLVQFIVSTVNLIEELFDNMETLPWFAKIK
jgi:hypothetical protein